VAACAFTSRRLRHCRQLSRCQPLALFAPLPLLARARAPVAEALASAKAMACPASIARADCRDPAATKASRDEGSRAETPRSLAPHLPPGQKIQTVAEALAAAKAIGSAWWRVEALISLAPHLSPAQMADALVAAEATGDERITHE
jgi:hypothetical protein